MTITITDYDNNYDGRLSYSYSYSHSHILPLRLITGHQIIKPFLKQGDVGTVEDMPEHIAILTVILLDVRRVN